ncbi:Amino acid permease 2 [Chlorella sorokiniana]|uniref:Amino acid permease 2 n=1 Tax=Chlorella sorokiniana TaxID=3076 RepID=A0A2P6U2T9_CHLSO|nr:Amino acid permease 2 [Chlorella sorokiniana]|eukprot:PRW60633.1 Amino acid permease 2 [Chlorella sorokiniana]
MEPKQVTAMEYAPNDKTGTMWTATMHIFCAACGAGVLGLPYAVGMLGWVAGPLLLTIFFLVARWTSILLSEVYFVNGIESARYHHAVRHLLGRVGSIWASIFQITNLVLLCLAYTITGADAMRSTALLVNSGFNRQWQMAVVFGGIELVLSQLPNLEEVWWVSALGTATSLLYCTIALVLGCIYADANQGSVAGIGGLSPANKAFGVLNAMGSVGFAYGFSPVLLEIQDTLKQPPAAAKTMRGAINIGVTVAFCFYLSVSVTGYSALGDSVPTLVLSGYTDAPEWVNIVAFLAIAAHMCSAYQVFAQPIFDTIESHVKAWRIRREQQVALALGKVPAGTSANGQLGTAASHGRPAGQRVSMQPSPFDAIPEEGSGAVGGEAKEGLELPTSLLAPPNGAFSPDETAQKDGADDKAAAVAEAGWIGTRHSAGAVMEDGPLGSRAMSLRLSAGGLAVRNSCPIPDLVPPSGWEKRPFERRWASHSERSSGSGAAAARAAPPILAAKSMAAALGSRAMYFVDTGAANEHVPLNETGYLLPLWQRLVIRSAFVVLLTFIAICMPFFNVVVGLVGSLCFWPLSIAFPSLMWYKVYRPTGWTRRTLVVVNAFMLLVCLGAVVGSVQSLINQWSSFVFFA